MKKVGLGILFLLAAFVVTGYLLPKQVHVERAILIERPVEAVFPLLDGFGHFEQWSPWIERDPSAEFVISGPASGVGARMEWQGDPQLVGSGWQEVVESRAYRRIAFKLEFEGQGVADTGFLLRHEGQSTHLTWTFDTDVTAGRGPVDALLARYFGLLFDRWIGRDYEVGLSNIKQLAESTPVSGFSPMAIERVNVEPMPILYVRAHSSQEAADAAAAMNAAFDEIGAYMEAHGIAMDGQPMAITRAWDEDGYAFDAAVPVKPQDGLPGDNVQYGYSPAGAAIRGVHRGPYDEMMPSYEKLAAYMEAHGLNRGTVSWEHYVTDPAVTPPDAMVTHIYIMLEEPAAAD